MLCIITLDSTMYEPTDRTFRLDSLSDHVVRQRIVIHILPRFVVLSQREASSQGERFG